MTPSNLSFQSNLGSEITCNRYHLGKKGISSPLWRGALQYTQARTLHKQKTIFADFLSTPPSALLQACFSGGFIELVCGVNSVSVCLCLSLSLSISLYRALSLSLYPLSLSLSPLGLNLVSSLFLSVGSVGRFGRSVGRSA